MIRHAVRPIGAEAPSAIPVGAPAEVPAAVAAAPAVAAVIRPQVPAFLRPGYVEPTPPVAPAWALPPIEIQDDPPPARRRDPELDRMARAAMFWERTDLERLERRGELDEIDEHRLAQIRRIERLKRTPWRKGKRKGRFEARPVKGDLGKALAGGRKSLLAIDPVSQVPLPLVEAVTVSGAATLTACDVALHEMLVAHARSSDPTLVRRTHEIEVRTALAFLGPNARMRDLAASLQRLRTAKLDFDMSNGKRRRTGSDFPVLLWEHDRPENRRSGSGEPSSAVIRYTLPAPVTDMCSGASQQYAQIEIAALAAMRSRYGAAAYRRIAVECRTLRHRVGQDSREFSMTSTEFAEWVGAPVGPGFSAGLMMRNVWSPAMADLAHVRRYEVTPLDPVRQGRGRKIISVRFRVTLRRTRHDTRAATITFAESREAIAIRLSVPDAPRYQVSCWTWLRLRTAFGMKRGDMATISVAMLADAWSVAVQEALTEVLVTEGYRSRAFRGAGLLTALDQRPADDVAWDFAYEERHSPDLIEWEESARFGRTCRLSPPVTVRVTRGAAKARYKRYIAHLAEIGQTTKKAQRATQANADAPC